MMTSCWLYWQWTATLTRLEAVSFSSLTILSERALMVFMWGMLSSRAFCSSRTMSERTFTLSCGHGGEEWSDGDGVRLNSATNVNVSSYFMPEAFFHMLHTKICKQTHTVQLPSLIHHHYHCHLCCLNPFSGIPHNGWPWQKYPHVTLPIHDWSPWSSLVQNLQRSGCPLLQFPSYFCMERITATAYFLN